MEIFAKGQLSFMMLDCLLDRDFYGLDFISEIYKKSNGQINLKKPSVYSNLTRMEKQGFVSSYTKSSDFGPNRRYYSITEKGRQLYNQLKNDFQRNNINVYGSSIKQENLFESDSSQMKKEVSDQYLETFDEVDNSSENDFFDFSSLNENKNGVEDNQNQIDTSDFVANDSPTENARKEVDSNIEIENENINFVEQSEKVYENPVQQENNVNNEIKSEKVVDKVDDGVFVDVEQVNQYNQRLYDITKDINKYRKKRSFAEDQIAMTVETPLQYSEERNKANIEAFKNSLMENKNKYSYQRMDDEEFKKVNRDYNRFSAESSKIAGNTYFDNKPVEEVVEDDGKFITNRIANDELLKPKKIQPPRLKILQNDKTDTLPPPNRDSKIDPSHKEIISRLYARTKDNQEQNSRNDSLYDYQDLTDFYKEQSIEFNEYKKTNFEVKHNTNKLYLIQSIIVFLLLAVASAATFIALYFTNCLNPTYNFLYIVLPALELIIVAIKLYNYKFHTSWIPKQLISFWQVLGYTILLIGAVVGVNFIFGLNIADFKLFATTLILPIIMIIIALPISYLIKKGLLVKFWH